jgi:hypothetical protein
MAGANGLAQLLVQLLMQWLLARGIEANAWQW